MVNWRFRAIFPLCASEIKKILAMGQFGKKKSIFSQDSWTILDRFLIRNFQNSIRTPLVFERNHPKLGQGLTLEGWCLYLAFTNGKSHWDKNDMSQWDRQIGTSCACPSGKSTACPNWDWERSKETSPCPIEQVIYPRWRPFLVPGQAPYPRWSLSQFHLSQLVPQSGSTRPWKFVCVCVVKYTYVVKSHLERHPFDFEIVSWKCFRWRSDDIWGA